MNLQEYIESGSIESCILGLADAAEQQEFERMREQYPEVQAAATAFEMSLEATALQGATPPPAFLREKILESIQGTHPSEQHHPANPNTVIGATADPILSEDHSETPGTRGRTRDISTGPGRKNWLVAASLLLIAGSTALNIYLYQRYKKADELYQEMLVQQEALTKNNTTLQTQLDEAEQDLALIQHPGIKQVVLGDMNNSKSQGTIYWNQQSNEVFLQVNHLPQPGEGQQYQLWAIVDGKPVDAGLVISPSTRRLQPMKKIDRAEAFAITLEKAGGSAAPTLSSLFVMGKI